MEIMTATEGFMKAQIQQLEEENKKLREENKKLKSDLDFVYIEGKILNNDLCVLRMENKKLKEELEWYKTEHERLVDKLVIKGATELLDRKFEIKKGWQGE